MNKIKKLCGFCINEWHLTTMLLPYISKEIENNYKMITILENSIEEQKLLVESGYNILMRYNPEENKLTIDSKEPNYSLYETVFAKEMRYKNLERLNEKEYSRLYNEQMKNAKERYDYYKSLSEH